MGLWHKWRKKLWNSIRNMGLREKWQRKLKGYKDQRETHLSRIVSKVGLSWRIIVPFSILILLSASTVGWITYKESYKNTTTLMEYRLNMEAKKMTEKISLLFFALDEKQFSKRFKYELKQQKADLANQGLNIEQYAVKQGQGQISYEGITNKLIPLDKLTIEGILKKETGVVHTTIHGKSYTVAFVKSPEMQEIFTIVVPVQDYTGPIEKIKRVVIYSIIGSITFATVLGLITVKMILVPFQQLLRLMNEVKAGNLTKRIRLPYASPEFQGLCIHFNLMLDEMTNMLNQVKASVKQLGDASEELQKSADASSEASYHLGQAIRMVSNGAEETASSTETSNTAFQAMKEVVMDLLNRVEGSTKSSEQMVQTAETGQKNMNDVITDHHALRKEMDLVSHSMDVLKNQSMDIEKILSMIGQIAEQTKLLALNAAIEAARAGESGRGFAVVANEVRKLADESAKATKEITSIISNIQHVTNEANTKTSMVSQRVEEGSSLAEKAESAFIHMISGMHQTNTQINSMYKEIDKISIGLREAEEKLSLFTGIAQETAASTAQMDLSAKQQQELAMKSGELSKNILSLQEQLDQMTRKFLT